MSILINNLVKYYGDLLIVNNFSVEISDGEFFALLGASGSGKSTVLRMIAGLCRPSSGKIELNGRDVTNLPPQKREVGFVFQNYAIFKHMTIAENIEFGLKVRRASKKERIQRQEELLELVGLSGLGRRYPHQISGGQRQRVALARALAYKPSVLLLDEPFGALDAGIRSQLRESVHDIQRKLRITTILVTHDQEEAFELADRIAVLQKGKLVEIGNAHSLYHFPKSSTAATFIGSGSVLVGRVNNSKIKLGKVILPLSEDAAKHGEGDPIRVLLRPENVVCSTKELMPDFNLITLGEGVIRDTLFSGSYVRLRATVLNLVGVRPLSSQQRYGEGIVVTSFQPSENLSEIPKEGDRCFVYLKKFHVLAQGGLRLLIKCAEPSKESSAWVFGSMLAAAARGKATLLHIFNSNATFETEKKKIEEIFLPDINPKLNLEFKVKPGVGHYQALFSAQEDFYEIVILERQKLPDGHFEVFNLLSIALLEDAKLPVLFTAEKYNKLEKILVCTAAGEPGKADVHLGARLARQTGASVTVMSVSDEFAGEEQKHRVSRHLQSAKSMLRDLGVTAETLMKSQPALESILSTAKQGDFDLIVIGAPPPHDSLSYYAKSLTSKIITATNRPVLVVPMEGRL